MVETVNNMRKTKSEIQIKYRQQNKQDRWQTIVSYSLIFVFSHSFLLVPIFPFPLLIFSFILFFPERYKQTKLCKPWSSVVSLYRGWNTTQN